MGVRGLWLSRCPSSVAFLSLSLPLSPLYFSTQQNISVGWSCNKILVHTPNPLFLSSHPSPSFPLSSLKSLHSSRQLSSGKRLAFWGRGSWAALMRRRCRVLCVYMWGGCCVCAGWGLRLDRKQPPLDDETGALFVYVLGSAGEVLVALEETHKPTRSSLPGLTCGRCWKPNGHLWSLFSVVTASRSCLRSQQDPSEALSRVAFRSCVQELAWISWCLKLESLNLLLCFFFTCLWGGP